MKCVRLILSGSVVSVLAFGALMYSTVCGVGEIVNMLTIEEMSLTYGGADEDGCWSCPSYSCTGTFCWEDALNPGEYVIKVGQGGTYAVCNPWGMEFETFDCTTKDPALCWLVYWGCDSSCETSSCAGWSPDAMGTECDWEPL